MTADPEDHARIGVVAVDGEDALAVIVIRPLNLGPDRDGVYCDISAVGISRAELGQLLHTLADDIISGRADL